MMEEILSGIIILALVICVLAVVYFIIDFLICMINYDFLDNESYGVAGLILIGTVIIIILFCILCYFIGLKFGWMIQ